VTLHHQVQAWLHSKKVKGHVLKKFFMMNLVARNVKMRAPIHDVSVFPIMNHKTDTKLLAAKRLRKLAALVDDLVDNDGILIDVDVQPITDTAPTHEGKTADLDAFFGVMFDHAGTNAKVKKHRKCKICL
jgi:hypothetical protein